MRNNYYNLSIKISAIGVGINVFLGIIKLILGIITNSIAIIADAFHSFSDLITTIVVIVSLQLSKKPADKQHPFGHGRIEDIGGLFVCFILAWVGFNFLRVSFLRLFDIQKVYITSGVIIVILITAVVKLFLGIFTNVFSKRLHSFILHTDAVHHYSDFLTSLVVGLGLVFVRKGRYLFDGYLGIFVAVVILFWAIKLAKEFIDNLIGKEVSSDIYNKIKEIVFSFPHIEDVHDINIHSYGRKMIVSLHIVVKKDLLLEEAHRLADSIEKRLDSEGIGKCIVHIDVAKHSLSPSYSTVEKAIMRLIQRISFLKGFHKVEIITTEADNILNFHLLIDKSISLKDSHLVSHRIANFLKKKFNFSEINIHIEPYLK